MAFRIQGESFFFSSQFRLFALFHSTPGAGDYAKKMYPLTINRDLILKDTWCVPDFRMLTTWQKNKTATGNRFYYSIECIATVFNFGRVAKRVVHTIPSERILWDVIPWCRSAQFLSSCHSLYTAELSYRFSIGQTVLNNISIAADWQTFNRVYFSHVKSCKEETGASLFCGHSTSSDVTMFG